MQFPRRSIKVTYHFEIRMTKRQTSDYIWSPPNTESCLPRHRYFKGHNFSVKKKHPALLADLNLYCSYMLPKTIFLAQPMGYKLLLHMQIISYIILTLLLLNTTCPVLANSGDPDQLADLDLHCLSFSMWISINNLDQVIWLAENSK